MADDEENITRSSWSEYRRLVLGELERLNASVIVLDRKMDELGNVQRRDVAERDDKLSKAIRNLEVSVAMLQVKSGVWGALSGLVVALTIVGLSFLKGH